MSSTRAISNGELWLPVIFFVVGIAVFLFLWKGEKKPGVGAAWLVGLTGAGFVASKLFAITLMATDSAPVPQGAGEPIKVIDGSSASISPLMTSKELEQAKVNFANLLKQKGAEVDVVGVYPIKAPKQYIYRINVKDGSKQADYFQGVVDDRLKTVMCNYNESEVYSAENIRESCGRMILDTFGVNPNEQIHGPV